MFRTYNYLLRPNTEQTKRLEILLWQSRLVYNAALEQRIKTYQETGKGIGYGAQWAHFRDLRHNSPDTLGQLNASSLQHLLRRLDKSFTAFFRRLKTGEKPGFPRFKSRHRFRSIEYTYGDGCKLRGEAQDEHGRMSFYAQSLKPDLYLILSISSQESLKIACLITTNRRQLVSGSFSILRCYSGLLFDPIPRVKCSGTLWLWLINILYQKILNFNNLAASRIARPFHGLQVPHPKPVSWSKIGVVFCTKQNYNMLNN